jgi:hypothetical protein
VVDELGLDDLATGGEDEGYVPCFEAPAADPADDSDDLAVFGEDGGHVPDGTGAASEPADESDSFAVYGTSSGFVAKPCVGDGCLGRDVFTRTVASGLGTSLFPGNPAWITAGSGRVDGTQAIIDGPDPFSVPLSLAGTIEILWGPMSVMSADGIATADCTVGGGFLPNVTPDPDVFCEFLFGSTDSRVKIHTRTSLGGTGASGISEAFFTVFAGDARGFDFWLKMLLLDRQIGIKWWLTSQPEPASYSMAPAFLGSLPPHSAVNDLEMFGGRVFPGPVISTLKIQAICVLQGL